MDYNALATVGLTIVGSLMTWYYSRATKKLANEQMAKQLFTEFNKRYAELNDFLNKIENKYPTMDELNKAEDSDLLKQKVIDYFSLCAEEFYWYHHKHRIDKIIWVSWQSGMNYWYQNVPAIKELWHRELQTSGKQSYYINDGDEFFQEKTL